MNLSDLPNVDGPDSPSRHREDPAEATSLFPVRVPEASEAMTPEESVSLAAWRATPLGYAVYSGLACHIVDRLGVREGRILSVGEGEGFLAAQIAALVPNAQVIGTDISADVIALARTRYRAPNLTFEVAAAGDLTDFGPADGVVCSFSLHHFSDVTGGIASMVEALAYGGRLYVQDLRRDAALKTYFEVLDMYVAHNLTVAGLFRASVNAAYTRRELEALLSKEEGGLDVGKVRFGARARAMYCASAAESTLASSLDIIDGLWVEALLERTRSRPSL